MTGFLLEKQTLYQYSVPSRHNCLQNTAVCLEYTYSQCLHGYVGILVVNSSHYGAETFFRPKRQEQNSEEINRKFTEVFTSLQLFNILSCHNHNPHHTFKNFFVNPKACIQSYVLCFCLSHNISTTHIEVCSFLSLNVHFIIKTLHVGSKKRWKWKKKKSFLLQNKGD